MAKLKIQFSATNIFLALFLFIGEAAAHSDNYNTIIVVVIVVAAIIAALIIFWAIYVECLKAKKREIVRQMMAQRVQQHAEDITHTSGFSYGQPPDLSSRSATQIHLPPSPAPAQTFWSTANMASAPPPQQMQERPSTPPPQYEDVVRDVNHPVVTTTSALSYTQEDKTSENHKQRY